MTKPSQRSDFILSKRQGKRNEMTLQTFLKLTPKAKNFETIAKYKFDTLFIHADQIDTLGNSFIVLLQKLNFFLLY